MSSGDFEKESDERAACHVVEVLLEQRRTIAAMRYNLLRRQMQQQQECILQNQRLILQSQKERVDGGKKTFVPELRPAPAHMIGQRQPQPHDDNGQGSRLGLSMPLFSGFVERNVSTKQSALSNQAAEKKRKKKKQEEKNTKTKKKKKKVPKKATEAAGTKKKKRSMLF